MCVVVPSVCILEIDAEERKKNPEEKIIVSIVRSVRSLHWIAEVVQV